MPTLHPISRIAALAAMTATVVIATSHAAEARDQIRAIGSSTVYPFITIAAEQFGKGGKFKTPIVESTGTGGGFKLFCAGVGPDSPDISNASRPITDSEKELCKGNGIGAITEIPLGYDGIAIVESKKAAPVNLTRQQLFMALGKQVPKDGKLVPNPYAMWSDVDPTLPKSPIAVYGPPPTSGTRDAFVELAFEEQCKNLAEFKAAYPDEKERGKQCKMVREDGKYIEAGEDDNLIIRKIESNTSAMGILGFSYLMQNAGKVRGTNIDGVEPTFDNISGGKYKLSRTLFIYVKNDHVGKIPGLAEFIQEATSDGAMGTEGYMVAKGLIPLHKTELAAVQAKAKALVGK